MPYGAFSAMKALSTRNDEPERASRPFDQRRDGFVLSEGSAIFVMESLEHARGRGVPILAEIVGVGNSSDAGHITAPDPEGKGAARSMRLAFRQPPCGDVVFCGFGEPAFGPLREEAAIGAQRPGRTPYSDQTPEALELARPCSRIHNRCAVTWMAAIGWVASGISRYTSGTT